jgi:hypothetical protein
MTSPGSLSFPQRQVWSEKLGLGMRMRPNSANSPSGNLLEADEIIVQPFELGTLTTSSAKRCSLADLLPIWNKERVGVILQRCLASIVEGWMVRARVRN